jgi:hypothetical protein
MNVENLKHPITTIVGNCSNCWRFFKLKIWGCFQNNREISTEYSSSELLFFVVSENSPPKIS